MHLHGEVHCIGDGCVQKDYKKTGLTHKFMCTTVENIYILNCLFIYFHHIKNSEIMINECAKISILVNIKNCTLPSLIVDDGS